MWTWDNSSTECERKVASTTRGVNGEACGELKEACDGADDCSLETLLEMYHYTNGTLMEMNGFIEDAIHEYRETIRLNPAEGFYHYNLGVALLKNSEFNEAYKELNEALRLNPDDYEARCALADVHCSIGKSLLLEGRLCEAAVEFRAAIAIDPEYPDYHACLGKTLLGEATSSAKDGQPDPACLREAVRELKAALHCDPECMEARLDLGVALVMGGPTRALDEGITVLCDFLKVDPFNDDAKSCLNRALIMKNQMLEFC